LYIELFDEVVDLGSILKNTAIILGVMAFLMAPLILAGFVIWALW